MSRVHMPVEELKKEREYVLSKRDALARKIADQEKKNKILEDKINLPENKKKSGAQALRDELKDIKEKMTILEKNSIDIGRNPSEAMERYSNPLLEELFMTVDTKMTPELEENLHNRGELEKKETNLNAEIYDEQLRQLFLNQEILDQKFLLEDMSVDIEDIKQRVEIVRGRKAEFQNRVSTLTHDFVKEVTGMTGELEEAKSEAVRWQKVRDRFEKLSAELESDRGSGSYRYQNSIEDIIERAEALNKACNEAHDVLYNFDQRLSSEFIGLEDIQ